MAHQYFDDNTALAHDKHQFKAEVRGETFSFTTDRGVFSRQGLDFGTRLLLESLPLEALRGQRLLDLGCGWGPVGVVLGRLLSPVHITMLDVSERALSLARENIQTNHSQVEKIAQSDAYAAVAGEKFDWVLTNPPIRAGKKVVHGFITGAWDVLQPGGHLRLVIQKKQGAPSAKKKMQEVFGQVVEITRKKGYWILDSQKES